MRKLYGFTILVLIGLYVFSLYFDTRKLFIYTTDRYFYTILGAAISIFAIGLAGLFFVLRSKRFKKQRDYLKSLLKDRKTILILVFSILGIFLNPLFLILSLFVLLFQERNSIFDRLLKGNIFRPFLLFIVIVAGIFIPSGQLSTATADQRLGNLNNVLLSSDKGIINNFSSNTESYDIGDWLVSLTYNPDLNFYVDKKVSLTGFIFKPENLDQNTFLLSRFVVRCCAADATPVGFKVDYDWSKEFSLNDWVNVRGTFQKRVINGVEDLIIVPETIQITEIPERPYIS